MAEVVELPELQDGYHEVVGRVLQRGEAVKVRDMKTYELRGVEIVVADPTRCLPVGVGRNLNTRIAAVEALQLIGGVLYPELMLGATRNFAEFMDGGTFHGGYGQRVRGQLPAVVSRLTDDPTTRRAVVTMWDPQHDLYVEGVHDYPCTISLQFLVRDRKLELHTHMRSNDVWRGLAYDAFVFTQLQVNVAYAIGYELGSYHHHVVSLHIYENDVMSAGKMLETDDDTSSPLHFGPLLEEPASGYEPVAEYARTILAHPPAAASRASRTGLWYISLLTRIVKEIG